MMGLHLMRGVFLHRVKSNEVDIHLAWWRITLKRRGASFQHFRLGTLFRANRRRRGLPGLIAGYQQD